MEKINKEKKECNTSFAYLKASIYRGLPPIENRKWDFAIKQVLPKVSNLVKKVDEFIYWVLSDSDSPLGKQTQNKSVIDVASLYSQKLLDKNPSPSEWEKVSRKLVDNSVKDALIAFGNTFVDDDNNNSEKVTNSVMSASAASAATSISKEKIGEEVIHFVDLVVEVAIAKSKFYYDKVSEERIENSRINAYRLMSKKLLEILTE